MAAATGVLAEIIDGDVYKYYADGEWKKSTSGKSVSIINPTTRKPQYKVQGNFHFSLCFQVLYFCYLV
jgi:glyceraldehyde-3-phosphate dehydrogenase (NADP+)